MEKNITLHDIVDRHWPLFKNYVGSPLNKKARAQDALVGLTYYVDDSSLRFFKSRITEAMSVANGLFFVIYESYAFDRGPRKHRFVVFDVTGEKVFRSDDYNSTSKVNTEFWNWFNNFNQKEHYHDKLIEERAKLEIKLAQIQETINMIVRK